MRLRRHTQTDGRQHRVVIIGSGFAGLFAARALRRAKVDVTVLDRTNHHLFQPLLYQVATGVLSEGDIAPPMRDVLRHQENTKVLLGDVVHIDLDSRAVSLDTFGTKSAVPYDSLIVAAGAGQSYFGHDEFAVHAPGMKTIDDALELRGRIFGAFEIAELARRALKDNFRSFNPKTSRIVLIDAVNTVLPPFPEPLQRRARRDLERLGIEMRLGTRVTGVDPEGLDLESPDGTSGRIRARTKIWA